MLYESIHKLAQNKQPKCEDGFEPVIQTIYYGHVKMALFIIERLVDKNPEAKNGWTALHIAAKYGRVEVCDLIMKHLKDKNPKAKLHLINI